MFLHNHAKSAISFNWRALFSPVGLKVWLYNAINYAWGTTFEEAAFIKKGNPLEESHTPWLFLLTSHLLTYSQTQRTAKKVRAIPFHAAKKAWRKSSDPRGLSMMRMANRILDKRNKEGGSKEA